ncbi:hypothetical protein [Microbispora rosea]|uniref:hypothetical protein n=1 Tax=Microbispora rosea TaxID=58117 RepID=UPI00379AA2D7
MTFSWDMLIAPGSALAGVGLTLWATALRERAHFRRQLATVQLSNRRAAYSNFLAASDLMEQIEKQIIFLLERGAGLKRDFKEDEQAITRRGPEQVAEMRRARAAMEIDGTPEVAESGRKLYEAHSQFEQIFDAAFNRRQYDDARAKRVLEDLDAARAAFVYSCRRELAADLLRSEEPSSTHRSPTPS